jgi:hypothetical protein
MKSILTLGLLIIATGLMAQTKKEQDRNAILAMEGCYKVTFDFAETFSPDTSYIYYDRYHSEGIEYVMKIADQEDLISFQHLLVINDTMIIKHWRQDWVYEEDKLLAYDKDKTWKHSSYSPEEVKGTWTQKVYQVDDSPRYESKGTWVHVDGKHFWEGTGDAPLPRREYTKRSDYNVMRRHNRIELSDKGWFLEQDNEKIVRNESGDRLICHEKGMESFTTGDYNCQPAIDWWEKIHMYWSEVRTAWNEVFDSNEKLQLIQKIDNKMLWQQLFELGDEISSEKKPKKVKTRAKEIIEAYIKA